MNPNEQQASEIIQGAFETNNIFLYFMNIKDDIPTLTDEECKNISNNYPISYNSIRNFFPKRKNYD